MLLPAPSCHRRRGLQSSHTGVLIQSAPIAWREHSRLAAKRPAAGLGGSGTAGAACLSRSARHPRRTAKPHTHSGPGFCCVCGQPVYRFGWHVDLWGSGPNKNAVWHSACVVAWQFWNAPSSQIQLLRRIQSRRCAQSGGRLWRNAEVDHRVPLFRVWSEHRDTSLAGAARFLGIAATFRSSIATSTSRNARWRRRAVEPYPLVRLNLRQAPDVKQVRGASRPIHRVIDRARRSSCRK